MAVGKQGESASLLNYLIIIFVGDAATSLKIMITAASIAIQAGGTTAVVIGGGVAAAFVLIGGAIAYNIMKSKKD